MGLKSTIRDWLGAAEKSPPSDTRSIENPATPVTMENLLAVFSGGPTAAGVPICESSALTLSAVWCAIRVLSEAVAMLPCRVRRSTADGDVDATTHRAYRLLRQSPNPYMTSFVFFETLMSHAVSWGNGYALIDWDRGWQPRGLYPLLPNETRPERVNGKLIYRWRGEVLADFEVLHIPGLGFDGMQGYSVVHKARENLGLAKAAETFGAKFFGDGATMAGVLEVPNPMKPEERLALAQTFDGQYGGINAKARTAVISSGAKYNRIGLPPEDSQFLETRVFGIRDVARWFKVPPHMLMDLERATFSNIEHQSLQFPTFTLTPWLIKIEQEINRKLLMINSGFVADFDETQLRRADMAARQSFYAAGRQWGFLNVNEIRAEEGLNRIENGDIYLQPVNMQQAGTPQADPAQPPADPPPDESKRFDELSPVIEYELMRMRDKEHLIRARHKEGEKLETSLDAHVSHIAEALGPCLKVLDFDAADAERCAVALCGSDYTIQSLKDVLYEKTGN